MAQVKPAKRRRNGGKAWAAPTLPQNGMSERRKVARNTDSRRPPILACARRRPGTAVRAVPQGFGLDTDCAHYQFRSYRRLTITGCLTSTVTNEHRADAGQQALVKRAIESGRCRREEEAVKEALALWEKCEHKRLEIHLALDDENAALARGEGQPITDESTQALARR
jgi:Arc/MetJ-type ribon-helix-helix transcriptional regulator